MHNTKITYGQPIDIFLPINNIKFEELYIPTNLNIYKDDEIFISLQNGKGFSINKIIETEEVFVDIAIGDTESIFDPGNYVWEIDIRLLNGDVFESFTGSITILDGNFEKKERVVKPWDLLNDNSPKVSKHIKKERLDICKSCPELAFGICKKCGCVMALKTMLLEARCPIEKW